MPVMPLNRRQARPRWARKALGRQMAHAVVPEHVVPAVQPHLVALGHQIAEKDTGASWAIMGPGKATP